MSDLSLTFIGSGNAFSPGGLCCNGFLVNGRFLFDAPPQALSSLNTIDVDPNTIEAVILSHHHGDHFLGLPFLLLHWRWKGRTKPVRIVGPSGTTRLGKQIAEQAKRIDEDDLVVSAAYANPGPSLKRIRPAPMGRAYRVVHRTTHLTVQVSEKEED